MSAPWVYPLINLDETPLADGTPVLRPAIPVRVTPNAIHLGVIDTGSPISVTSAHFARRAGIDPDSEPAMEVPLGLGGRFQKVPLFEMSLDLVSPDGSESVQWRLHVGTIQSWHFPFDILLGQRGWTNSFTTTLGVDRIAIERAQVFDERFGVTGEP